jgi:probable biosynthetic protein (TIGR04098 family)
MLRSRSRLHLCMPHTVAGGLGEGALLAHTAYLQWSLIRSGLGVPMSRLRDADGKPVYASVYFVDILDLPERGLAAFGPDDEIDVASTVVRFGRTMFDGEHRLYAAGAPPAESPRAPRVRLSNVCVCERGGPDDLRITAPVNARIEGVPSSAVEPDSYAMIKVARREGRFFSTPAEAQPLWEGARTVAYKINPDRDVNGVGLVYFVTYVVAMDLAERQALEETGAYPSAALDGRATVRRRIGFYGNAQHHDTLTVEVEASRLPGAALLCHFRVRRSTDERLIAVASVEKLLRA